MRYAYYPGCAAKSSCLELDVATKAVASELGIDLVELSEASCCGAREISSVRPRLALTLNARTFALAEKLSPTILTICSTCQLTMSQANDVLKSDRRTLAEVNETLSNIGLRYGGGVEVKHLLNVLEEDYGFNRLAEKIKVSLDNLNVAAFYGCHLLRPARSRRNKTAKPHGPMETLIETLGGRVVDGSGGKVCCGFPVLLTNEQLAVKMSGDYLKRLKDDGTDCIVTPCPLCHISFDMYQGKVESALDVKIDLVVLHLSQLIGLGLGLNARQLMTNRNVVSAEALLKRIGL